MAVPVELALQRIIEVVLITISIVGHLRVLLATLFQIALRVGAHVPVSRLLRLRHWLLFLTGVAVCTLLTILILVIGTS